MAGKNKDIAQKGECLAANFLKKKGYQILNRNWRYSNIGELDIIAKQNSVIAFIEVKTRTSKYCGEPLESITKSKQRQIARLAEIYINESSLDDNVSFRFDAVSVLLGNEEKIYHLEDAFQL